MEQSFASMRQLDHHTSDPVRIYHNCQDDEYPGHWHYSYEIIMPVLGGYTAVVDQTVYEILPGEVFLIPSGVVHELFPESAGGERYIFMVDQDYLLQMEGFPINRHILYPCVHLRHGLEDDILLEVSENLWKIVHEQVKGDTLSGTAMRAWTSLVLLGLIRWLNVHRPVNQNERRHAMNAAMLDVYAYITAHCSEKLTLEEMASHAGYSKYHFGRVFKEYTGTGFHDFWMRERTKLCARMLTELNIPVTEVALRAGFGSIASFNRLFKQNFGMSPTEYRNLKAKPVTGYNS